MFLKKYLQAACFLTNDHWRWHSHVWVTVTTGIENHRRRKQGRRQEVAQPPISGAMFSASPHSLIPHVPTEGPNSWPIFCSFLPFGKAHSGLILFAAIFCLLARLLLALLCHWNRPLLFGFCLLPRLLFCCLLPCLLPFCSSAMTWLPPLLSAWNLASSACLAMDFAFEASFCSFSFIIAASPSAASLSLSWVSALILSLHFVVVPLPAGLPALLQAADSFRETHCQGMLLSKLELLPSTQAWTSQAFVKPTRCKKTSVC